MATNRNPTPPSVRPNPLSSNGFGYGSKNMSYQGASSSTPITNTNQFGYNNKTIRENERYNFGNYIIPENNTQNNFYYPSRQGNAP